jgi:hypothetical protein
MMEDVSRYTDVNDGGHEQVCCVDDGGREQIHSRGLRKSYN